MFAVIRSTSLFTTAILITLCFNAAASYAQSARITSVLGVEEIGDDATGAISIDINQDQCGTDTTKTPEEFNDTLVRITVENNTLATIIFTKLYYTVSNPYNDGGGRIKSRKLAPLGNFEVKPDGKPQSIFGLFLDVSGANKTYAGLTRTLPDDLGFKNVTFYLEGRTSTGRKTTLRARTAFSFGNIVNCP